MKYILIYTIGLYVIYIGCIIFVSADNLYYIVPTVGFSLCICTLVVLSIHVKDIPNLKYAMAFVAGLLIISMSGFCADEDSLEIVGGTAGLTFVVYIILTYIFALIDFQIVWTITYWILKIVVYFLAICVIIIILGAVIESCT